MQYNNPIHRMMYGISFSITLNCNDVLLYSLSNIHKEKDMGGKILNQQHQTFIDLYNRKSLHKSNQMNIVVDM